MPTLVMIACAYEIKHSLGGGFRAVVLDKRNGKQRHEGHVHPTLQAARNEAKATAATLLGTDYGNVVNLANIYRKSEWVCNYWSK